jgi:hypothetical protein
VVETWAGRLDAAAVRFADAAAVPATETAYERAGCLGYLALVEALRGRLTRAVELAGAAAEALSSGGDLTEDVMSIERPSASLGRRGFLRLASTGGLAAGLSPAALAAAPQARRAREASSAPDRLDQGPFTIDQDEGWFTIATGQLAGNALGRIIPGSATPFTVVMLRKAGVDGGDAAAALTASTGLQIATALALPVLAVPAILGGAPVDRGLAMAAYLGGAVVVLLVGTGAVLFTTDAPLERVGRWVQSVLNVTVRRRRPVEGLPEELISDRNFIRTTLDRRWKSAILSAAGNTGFDYLALLCALRAVGASPRPSLVVLAYASAELLAQIPFTPGGLGFVEAGLVGTLTLAGVPGHAALAATLLYRLVSYWLPIPVGGVAYLLIRRRYGSTTVGDRQAGDGV